MTNRKDRSRPLGDIERPHLTVVDSIGDEPLTVRLGDLWSDFIRAADEACEPRRTEGFYLRVPLLDDMKGILQWD